MLYLAGFEPGSNAPLADAMTTAPRHQGKVFIFFIFKQGDQIEPFSHVG
jgi:hypothetical protein